MRITWCNTAVIMALPVGALLSADVASAQWRVVQPEVQAMRFAEMDANGDGVVTRSEWRGTRRAFNQADWNRDGVLSGDEVRLDDADGAVGTSGVIDRREEFSSFDRNADGVLNRYEWRGIRSTFDLLDTNDDGVVTVREYIANNVDADGRTATGRVNRQGAETVYVNPQQPWTRTGIFVNRGDTLRFNSRGLVQWGDTRGDIANPAGAESGERAPGSPLPEELAGALIGRIGNSEPFGIGDQQQITAPATGELFLGVNDSLLSDNRGGFQVQVGVR